MFDGKGIFGGLFDLDGDGELDSLEMAMDFAAFMQLISSDDGEPDDDSDFEDCDF